jgi:hypothetical protein
VWTHGSETERDDLAISLNHSGAGVRHILIQMLMAFSEPLPSIILIDELEHSLHPGATRELLELFATDFSHHQFVIGTHSATAVASSRPATIAIVKKSDERSTVQSVDRNELRYRQQLLAELGASVADLFGADAVLWVEGATEEICFPRILETLANPAEFGPVVIKGLIHTGDLERKRDADKILQIYDKLSGADALLPPAIGFILDDDGRTLQVKEDLRRRSKGRMSFTKRRMFENYLIQPSAIASVLSEIDGMAAVSAEVVATWLNEHAENQKYRAGVAAVVGEQWQTTIHAGTLLKDLFSELSQQRVHYERTEHSVKLTDWLLEHDSGAFAEIADLIRDSIRRTPLEKAAEIPA